MSLEHIKKTIQQKASKLDTPTQNELEVIEQIVKKKLQFSVRVLSVKHQTIKLEVDNSAAASEVFLQKYQILSAINKQTGQKYRNLAIRAFSK